METRGRALFGADALEKLESCQIEERPGSKRTANIGYAVPQPHVSAHVTDANRQRAVICRACRTDMTCESVLPVFVCLLHRSFLTVSCSATSRSRTSRKAGA